MVSVGWCLPSMLLLVYVSDVLVAHNLDVSPQRIFSTNGGKLFGYRVQQIRSTHGERILVGDPDLGQLHSCDVIKGTCDIISLPNQNRTGHIGLTLEVEPETARCIVCGSDVPHECDQMLYMNGACYTLDSSLTPAPQLLPGYQECQKAEVDLCFLFDGSGSSGVPELISIKYFLKDAIKNLRNTTVHLAIVQFSGRVQTELDFTQYQKTDDLMDVIDKLTLLGGGTKTFNAIRYTLKNIFAEKAGHRPRAKKVLLILTDGEANDDKGAIIEQADKLGVKRYLIGVGNNFNTSEKAKQHMKELASEPTAIHTRVLNNFKELENLFVELQQKILAIEGVQTCYGASGGDCNGSAQGPSFSRELSSAGLSAALTQEWQLLGDPGIFDWSGGILDISGPEKLINTSLQEDDGYGYLGYSVAVIRCPEGRFYIAGAPRHQYVGLVIVFQETADGAERIQNISGEQVGSYFGSEIEVCDMDQDGLSDVVLIAAPYFYDVRWSGQVSVYQSVLGRLQFRYALHGESGHLHSQFGVALSSLSDLNGDGFRDVAVGAPFEMEGRGALYIYGGEAMGVNPKYSQRLTGSARSYNLGLSVHGVLDMTKDGLTDVAVGTAGGVALFRSRPLLNVTVTMTSTPPEIPIPTVEGTGCDIEVILQICVDHQILTSQYTGPMNVSLLYMVTLDSVNRMSFTNSQKEMQRTVVLRAAHRACWNHSMSLQDCFLEDTSPMLVSFSASQIPNVSHWILSPSSYLMDTIQIPFQLCGNRESCEPDFHLSLQMEDLVVEKEATFSLFLRLQNKGQNAQRVRLWATYSAGLSYRKANITEGSRRMALSCDDLGTQNLVCNVSHPIMRRASWAKILIMFGIVTNVSWPDQVLLSLHVTSENDGNKTSLTNKVIRDIPIMYPINIIARRVENSTKYLKFLKQSNESNVTHVYQIQSFGTGPRQAEFTFTVMIPAMTTDDLIWEYHVICWVCHGACTELGTTDKPGNKTFLCTGKEHGTINIHVTGVARPVQAWTVTKSVNLSSTLTISYNQSQYHSRLGGKFHRVQVMTQVDLVVLPNHVPYIVGGTVGGVILLLLICVLLYKCGFFKRYKDRMEEGFPLSDVQQPLSSHEEDGGGGPEESRTRLAEPPDPSEG